MEQMDWSNLGFGYRKTDYNVRCYYRDGKWGEIEVCSEETIPLHMAATCLHYGQEAFEGLKAYRCPDGKVRVFRSDENAARLQSTCRGILMPELSTEKFNEMVDKVVRLNERFIPPYETGATLYIRPLLIGTSAQVGVHPSQEYLFMIFVTPVGPYFKGGFSCNDYVIIREYDRSALSAQVSIRWVVTMQLLCVPTRWLTISAMLVSSISTLRRRSIWTSVVLPISSASRTIPT
jgi:branched-chain amino acid aminotransferase